MKSYDHNKIEKKWQKEWGKKKIYQATDKSPEKKFYPLVEFPFPSGAGLHTGHIRSYTAMDIIARKHRMQGENVLYPMGWDAFGLPTENYALKTGISPKVATKQNTDNFRRQLQSLGFSFDWSREINTTDPEYYRWTQWIFLQMYKKSLAYKAKMEINWCPKDKIGLANEEVIDGCCERCGTPVEKRLKEQWMLAITEYADRLYDDLDTVDYSERIKIQQRNWIGRSEGALIKFDDIEVFTTRPDTIYGVTFIAVAGKENKFTGRYVTNPATKEKVPVWEADYVFADYGTGAIMAVPAHDERDFVFAKKYKLPLKTIVEVLFRKDDGTDAVRPNIPFVERKAVLCLIKHWSEDKYLCSKWKSNDWQGFVTGGIENGEDEITTSEREIAEETGYTSAKYIKTLGTVNTQFYHDVKKVNRFAHFKVVYLELENANRKEMSKEEQDLHDVVWVSKEKVRDFVNRPDMKAAWDMLTSDFCFTGEGLLVDSGKFSGMTSEEAKKKITQGVGGKWVTKFKLRDWIFSRQRYWGEPIPMIHCEKCGWTPVPEKDLPVKLPEVKKYEPTDTGESPLANISKWVNVKCPTCGAAAKRETDTMPNWAGSSWYYIRYVDPKNKKAFADRKKIDHFLPVDWYNGGMEHTTLHLLYSRFWHKFLFDEGLVNTTEPYKKRTSHGLILAEGGVKMSKSLGNVVSPDELVTTYGADTLRMYEMFMGPFDQAIAWDTRNMIGPRRFIERVWKLQYKVEGKMAPGERVVLAKRTSEAGAIFPGTLHKTIKKVSEDIESMGFNTAISSLMILTNALEKEPSLMRADLEIFLKLLAPFAPHVSEEIWRALGNKTSIHISAWPTYDAALIKDATVKMAVQVNGKVRAVIELSADADEGAAKALALAAPEAVKWLAGKTPTKTIYVKGKIINFIISS